MPFKVRVYIPIEPEDYDEVIYETKEEAESCVDSLRLMQPENVYEVVETLPEKENENED